MGTQENVTAFFIQLLSGKRAKMAAVRCAIDSRERTGYERPLCSQPKSAGTFRVEPTTTIYVEER